MAQRLKKERRVRRHRSLRKKLAGTAEQPRLYVFRSGRHICAGLADDDAGRTILSVSTTVKELREKLPGQKTGNCLAAKETGKLLAVRAKEKGIQKVVFDRGGFLYHGRVKALAEGAREGGLRF